MKLVKLYQNSKKINKQACMYVLGNGQEAIQYVEYVFTEKIGSSESLENCEQFLDKGLIKIDFEKKSIEKLSGKNIMLFYESEEYCFFLHEYYNPADHYVGIILRYDKKTKEIIESEEYIELKGSLTEKKRLVMIDDFIYLRGYRTFYIFNKALECIYCYKSIRSICDYVYWDNRIMFSCETLGCKNSTFIIKHYFLENRYESYPITCFFQNDADRYGASCFKILGEYLLIKSGGHSDNLVVVDENLKIIFQSLSCRGEIYFAHPKRKELLIFQINYDKTDGEGKFLYADWSTQNVLWELRLEPDFDINWYQKEPYFWEEKDKLILDGFKNNKKGFWVIDIATGIKEFFQPVGNLFCQGEGAILFREDSAYINTVSSGKRNYYYKLTE